MIFLEDRIDSLLNGSAFLEIVGVQARLNVANSIQRVFDPPCSRLCVLFRFLSAANPQEPEAFGAVLADCQVIAVGLGIGLAVVCPRQEVFPLHPSLLHHLAEHSVFLPRPRHHGYESTVAGGNSPEVIFTRQLTVRDIDKIRPLQEPS
jgi:hypothetical protein